jgi:multiple sugar transport system permease protein
MNLGQSRLVRLFIKVGLAGWGLFVLFPLYWVAITSLKRPEQMGGLRPTFWPYLDFQPTFQAWLSMFGLGQIRPYEIDALEKLSRFALNSLVAAGGSAGLATLLGMLAAYGLARFRFQRWRNRDIAFWLVSLRMLPPIALAVPFFILFNFLNLIDTLFILILVYTAMNLPIVIWILKDYFQDIPIEIEEAARVDGCSHLGAFGRIALPLALPGLLVAFLLAFVFAWNEFILAYTLTFSDAQTLPILLAGRRGGAAMAAQAMLMLLPPLLVTVFAGRFIIRGLARGALK